MKILNLTADVESRPEEDHDDVVFRLNEIEIWRAPARWQRYDETGIDDAVYLFAERLGELLEDK